MHTDKIFHIISNTHWDREWRFPFQRNRQMLVDMIDNLIEILQNEPDYKAFHLDSQAIIIDDYLEIKPQNENLIRDLINNKKIFIGPWYILPDEFQVGGENLIRNLLLGHKVSRKYGRISKTGYSPFSWGQISQLPQIYSNFGIDFIMFYRGVNFLESPKAEFLWKGADGTTLLTSRFSTMPRYNFYFYIYRRILFNENISDVKTDWNAKGQLFHSANPDTREDYFNISPDNKYYFENLKEAVEKIIEDQADDFTTPHVIWMEGHDSSGPHKDTITIIKDIKKIFPDLDIRHSTLEDYAEAVKASVDYKSLPVVKGERRSAQYNSRSGNLYGYTTSARMYLKQKNFEAEKWLQYYAEPFSSVSELLGADINNKYLDKAWNYLIQNSAHDSIGGCSLDEIHEDMMWRYKQVVEISKGNYFSSLKTIVKHIKPEDKNKYGLNVVVFNPLPFSRDEIKELIIDIPEEYDCGYLFLEDENGYKPEIEIIERKTEEPVLEQLTDRPMFLKMIRYKSLVYFKNVEAFGYNSYSVIPVKRIKNSEPVIAKLKNNLPVLENNFLRVRINRNGTLNILNKLNGTEINNTGYLYDEGEAGHAWINKPEKPFLTTLKSSPDIKVIRNNSLAAECRIKYRMLLPANKNARMKKNGRFINQEIECIVKLERNSKRIDYTISLNNRAEDHRLRIMFPAGIISDYSYGEGQFDVVKRSTKRPDTRKWMEQPMYDFPMHHFVDLSNGRKGAAVIVDGLKEYEILKDKQTIAVTLLRCFEYVIQPASVERYSEMKGSQCPGKHVFRLSLYPHNGDWKKGNVFTEALRFNYNIDAVQTGNGKGKLPRKLSFLKIDPPEIIMSCFKKSEDGSAYIIRMYNPTESDTGASLYSFFRIKKAEQVTLEENTIKIMEPVDQNRVNINIKKKEIFTLKLFPEPYSE